MRPSAVVLASNAPFATAIDGCWRVLRAEQRLQPTGVASRVVPDRSSRSPDSCQSSRSRSTRRPGEAVAECQDAIRRRRGLVAERVAFSPVRPSKFVTRSVTGPAVFGGVVITMRDDDCTLIAVGVLLPSSTLTPTKFAPSTVNCVPPVVGPVVGVTDGDDRWRRRIRERRRAATRSPVAGDRHRSGADGGARRRHWRGSSSRSAPSPASPWWCRP